MDQTGLEPATPRLPCVWAPYGGRINGFQGGDRTHDHPITRIPLFLMGVDYIILHEGGRALVGFIGWAPHPLVSAPSQLLKPFVELGSGLPCLLERRFRFP